MPIDGAQLSLQMKRLRMLAKETQRRYGIINDPAVLDIL
jgi:hypothetical protein